MSLVQYPDSDSDGDGNQPAIAAQPPSGVPKAVLKRKHSALSQDDLPPLPAAFHDLYATNARMSTSDNPELHGGRKRAMPHVEGNWPSHVYLEWNPSQPESDSLHGLIRHVRDTVHLQNKEHPNKLPVPKLIPSLQSELGAPLPLHISLSRTLQLKTEDRAAYLDTLKVCLRKAAVPSFAFDFHCLKWVPNFQRNRWFLVLGIRKPAQNELNRLLGACNDAAAKCGHPGLYVGGYGDGPMEQANTSNGSEQLKAPNNDDGESTDYSHRFHVSIAWNLEEPAPEWIDLVKNITVSEHIKAPQSPIGAVKARIGNMVHSIELGAARSGRGIGRGSLGRA
ncbi:poly(U)-specific 3'-to-5' RNA exonuclease [Pleosporales sp. CAS-2024a]